jgi:hypothetical protein
LNNQNMIYHRGTEPQRTEKNLFGLNINLLNHRVHGVTQSNEKNAFDFSLTQTNSLFFSVSLCPCDEHFFSLWVFAATGGKS